MKYNHSLLALILMMTLVWSCGEKDNMDELGEWEMTTPALSTPASTDVVLNESAPSTKYKFEWQAVTATNRFVVQYTYVLVPAGNTDYANPLLSVTPANNGRTTFVEPTAQQIDYALWAACYPAGQKVNLSWAVVAKVIERTTVATQNIAFTRFATEYFPTTLYLTGSATEAGANVTDAIQLRTRKDADEDPTLIFDGYGQLTAGGTYMFRDLPLATAKKFGGEDGDVEGCGPAIQATESGVYRISVNLNNNSYELWNVEKWSLVGDAVEGGWGGDVPLAYQGDGVWSGRVNFLKPYETADFIFRANGNWDYIIKRIEGTETRDDNGGDVLMESEAGGAGVTMQNIPVTVAGMATVTLNLSAEGYTYTIVPDTPAPVEVPLAILGDTETPDNDNVSGNFTFGTYTAPAQLFLVHDGAMVAELTKNGDTFESGEYLALEEGETYILNSESDGSGTTYNDVTDDGSIEVARDQAYQITVNFATGKLVWKYFNIKLFHWDDPNNGWDARQEILMTYQHPHTFKVTNANLSSGFDSKFNSPWDVQFGTSSSALSGTMTNGGDNYKGIISSGMYNATIVTDDTYATCTYTFVKQ